MPPLRSWEKPVNAEKLLEARAEIGERLNIIIRPIYVSVSVTKVYIRDEEFAVFI